MDVPPVLPKFVGQKIRPGLATLAFFLFGLLDKGPPLPPPLPSKVRLATSAGTVPVIAILKSNLFAGPHDPPAPGDIQCATAAVERPPHVPDAASPYANQRHLATRPGFSLARRIAAMT